MGVASDFVVAVPSMNVHVATAGASAVMIVLLGVANYVDASVLIVILPLNTALVAMSLCAPIVGVNLEVKESQFAKIALKGRAMPVDWTWLYQTRPKNVVLI